MRCTVEPDLPTFAETVLPWLGRNPVVHNVIATLVGATLDGTRPLPPGEAALWAHVRDDAGDLVGVAVRTPPFRLLLSRMPAEAVEVLAACLADREEPLPGVTGPVPVPGAFAAAWSARTGSRVERARGLRVYACPAVRPPTGVPGQARQPVEADLPVLVEWAAGFSRDTGTPPAAGPGEATRADLARRSAARRLLVWEDAGTPVSMAAWSPPAAGVRRVSLVYTPPALRRRGYACAVTAAATERALADVGLCMLYADLDNPTSNGIYQRIGYRQVADSEEWTLGC